MIYLKAFAECSWTGCCARAASGQETEDAAAPPSSVNNLRRD
jgi:hypothetical protein